MDYLLETLYGGLNILLTMFFFITAIFYWVNYKTSKNREMQEYTEVTYATDDGSNGQYLIEDDLNLYIDLESQLDFNAQNVKTVQLF